SATLLVVLSPAYVASAWCRREIESFLGRLRERFHDGSRVFIVEKDEVDRERVPPELLEYGKHQFWERDALKKDYRMLGRDNPNADTLYNDRIDRLARELASKLRELRPGPWVGAGAAAAA